MKQSLIKFLNCLKCKGDLSLTESIYKNDIENGTLHCTNCSEAYEIRDGVPNFTKYSRLGTEERLTARNFTYSWQKFSSYNKTFYRKQFFDWISPVNEDFLKEKTVLDSGCGKGHHLRMINTSVKEAIGVDISDSVYIAYENTKELSNIHIIKADLNNLPLKDSTFDYAYSIGVIHHTENPKATAKNIFSKVKKGGHLSLWVYGKENNWWVIYFIDPTRKLITKFFPPNVIHIMSFIVSIVLFTMLKCLYLPTKHIAALRFLKHLLPYYPYLSYICIFDFNEINNIVFDHLVAPTSHYLSKQDVQELIDSKSTDISIFWHNNNSWRSLWNKKN